MAIVGFILQIFAAVMLQSSAAVALLLCGVAATGMLGFPAGLAALLGADLGSALVIQFLSLDLQWLQPILLVVGGWLYVKSDRPQLRITGRIILGLALILVSLQLLREAVAPLRENSILPAVADYIAADKLTGFLIGAALAFTLHSSVAAILMCVALVQTGALVPAGFGLARHVLLVDDIEAARRLVLDKAAVKRRERSSRKAHLKRLESGQSDSFESSDVHLETLRCLRELYGHIAAVAYPILYRNGQMLETRLVTEMISDTRTN